MSQPLDTICVGIHESDLILQTALRAAIADLRAKPYLLDYCFTQLKDDTLLQRDYGETEIEKAKRWFIENDIPVYVIGRNNRAKFPCVSLKVMASNEAEASVGDVNADPYEDTDPVWPVLAGPFDAVSYVAKTGTITIPDPGIITAAGQMVVTRTGNAYQVTSAPDRVTLVIAPNTKDDFAGMTIRGQQKSFIASLESVEFAETYMIGCHAPAEPQYASYLHSIIKFCLLMYRQSLLEARNFEQSQISSTAAGEREQVVGTNEIVYTRYIQISGRVRCGWPKVIGPKVNAFQFQPRILGAGKIGPKQVEDVAWLGDGDDPLVGN